MSLIGQSMHMSPPEGAVMPGAAGHGELLQGAAPVEVQVAEVGDVLNLMAANFEQRFQEMDDRLNFISANIEQRFLEIDERSRQVEVTVHEVRNQANLASAELGGEAQDAVHPKQERGDILMALAEVYEDINALRQTHDRSCRDVEALQLRLDADAGDSPKQGMEALRLDLTALREELHRTTHTLIRRCEEAEVACGQGIEGVQESTAVTARELRNEQQGIMGQCERMVASLKESLEVSMAQHVGTTAAGTEALRRELSSVQAKGQLATVEASLTQIRAQIADGEARDNRLREEVSSLKTSVHHDTLLLDEKILQMRKSFTEVHEDFVQGGGSPPGNVQDKRCAALERAVDSMRLEFSDAKTRLQAASPQAVFNFRDELIAFESQLNVLREEKAQLAEAVFNGLRGDLAAFESQLNVLREEKAQLAEALHQDVVQAQLLALREEATATQMPPSAGQSGVDAAALERLQQEMYESARDQQQELQRVERYAEKEVASLRTVVSSLRKEVVEIGRDVSEASPGTRSTDLKPPDSKMEVKLTELGCSVERALEHQRLLNDSVEAKVGIIEKMLERQQSLDNCVDVKLGTVDRMFQRQQSLEETVATKLGIVEEAVATKLGAVEEAVAAKLGAVDGLASRLGTVEETVAATLGTGTVEEVVFQRQRSLNNRVEAKPGIVKGITDQQLLEETVAAKVGAVEEAFAIKLGAVEEAVAAKFGTVEALAARLGTVEGTVATKLDAVEGVVTAKLGMVEEIFQRQQSLEVNVENVDARLMEIGGRVDRSHDHQRQWEKQHEDRLLQMSLQQPRQLVINPPQELESPDQQSQPQQHMQLFGTEAVVETLREEIQQLHYGQGRLANQITSLQDIKQLVDDTVGDEVARRSMLISELHTRIAKEVAEVNRQMELQREAVEGSVQALSCRTEVMSVPAELRQPEGDNGRYDRVTELLERERSERVFDTTATRAEIAKGLQTERDCRLREAVELRKQLSSALSTSLRDGAEVAKRLEPLEPARSARECGIKPHDKEPEWQSCWSRSRPPPDAGEQQAPAAPPATGSATGVLGPALTPRNGSLS